MNSARPICCNPQAFRLLGSQIPFLDSDEALVTSACAISIHEAGDVDPSVADRQIQAYADRVRLRVRGSQPQAILAHLHDVLFDEEGFTGNQETFENLDGSYLPAVLQTRRGLPVTLSLIYKSVAQRLGLRAFGVGLPGHFVVGVEADGGMLMIDPFCGGAELSRGEAHQRLTRLLGEDVEWSDELIAPVTHRQWVTRILQNLLNLFAGNGQYQHVAAMLEMEMLLWPDEDRLQRDLALVLARCGLSEPAFVWLDQYLRNHPEDPQESGLRQLLHVLAP